MEICSFIEAAAQCTGTLICLFVADEFIIQLFFIVMKLICAIFVSIKFEELYRMPAGSKRIEPHYHRTFFLINLA